MIVAMKRFKILLALLVLSFSSVAQQGDAVLGIWQSEHGNGRIQIYKTGELYNGKLVWLTKELNEAGKPKLDINNPVESLRSHPIKGLEVLKNFSYKNEGNWDGGTVYDPRSGKTYNCKLFMSSSDELEVRAFMGISLFGKTQVWSRVK
jgi:uncharacterized protein (DUF2147 family)